MRLTIAALIASLFLPSPVSAADGQATNAAKCGLPPVPGDALIASVGVKRGAALSNVTIGDDTEVTETAQVDIQEGDRPLYIMLVSDSHMIWLFSGATGRIVNVVALSGHDEGVARSGVVGIDKSKVVIRAAKGCIQTFYEERGAAQNREVIESHFGRRPDFIAARDQVSRVRLPGGSTSSDHPYPKSVRPPTGKAARSVYEESKHIYPLGLADISPSTVVSASPARLYQIPPSYIGLAHLVDKGLIEIIDYATAVNFHGNTLLFRKGQIDGVSPKDSRDFPSKFRIIGPITFPAGLNHLHLPIDFVVAKGVPMPGGKVGRSKVICEVTGAHLKAGAVCE